MITCSITTSVLGCLVTSYLFFRYTWALDIGLLPRIITFAAFILIGCIPLLVSYQSETILGKAYGWYRYSLYFLFIGAIILFTITLIGDALFFIVCHTPLIGKFKFICCCYNYIYLALALICTSWALYAGTKVPAVKEIDIASPKITEPLKIALLSDLHIHRVISPAKVKAIVEKTNALNPDVILLAGDILDDNVAKIAPVTNLLKGLKAKHGIYYVTGNHEFYTGYHLTVNELNQLGFKLLKNDGISVDSVYIAGIPDTFTGKYFGKTADLSQAFAAASKDQFRILMSHTPTEFKDNTAFDLEVSGHTHGGQIFPFHIFAKLHNQYLAGRYDMKNGSQIYVSSGAGQWGPQMRFLAPSEITLINLKPQGETTMKKAPIDTVFNQGEPNPYGKFFTGQTYLQRLSANDEIWNSSLANVTFEPGARTNWHKHSGGQILLVLAGEGRYQERGKEIQILHKGDVVRIPLNVEHWHGAAPDSWFTHISVETNLPNNQTTWLEPVTDEEYK